MMPTPSGFYYPNKIARITFEAAQNVLGTEAMTDLLHAQGLEKYIQAFPPDNLQREFDFADFTALAVGIDALQAQQPHTPSLGWQVGARCFESGLKSFGAVSSFGAVA